MPPAHHALREWTMVTAPWSLGRPAPPRLDSSRIRHILMPMESEFRPALTDMG